MPRYVAWLPAWASVRYVLETEEAVTDPAELKRRMLEEGAPSGSLCHQCNDDIECEGDYDQEAAEKLEFEVVEI